MIVFWLASVAMIAAALAFVIPASIRATTGRGPSRHQANLNIYRERLSELELQEASATRDAAREELDREMLALVADSPEELEQADEPREAQPLRAIVIAILLPLITVAIYIQVGSPRLLLEQPATPTVAVPAGTPEHPSGEDMVAQLEQRLQAAPDDIRTWLMLGRTYSMMNRNEDARATLAKTLERAPNNPEVMVSYAEVLTTLNQGSLDGEPIALVNRALTIEADSPRALWLAGIHSMNQGVPAQALGYWQKILDSGKLAEQASAQVQQAITSVRAQVVAAQGGAGGAAGGGAGGDAQRTAAVGSNVQSAANTAAAPAPSAAAGKATIQVNVSLSEELRSRVSGQETVFVFARASNGPPMPLAAQRLTAAQLPITVHLDDSNAMAPEMAISRFETVVITARVSRTGAPRAAPGDLQGKSGEVATRGGDPVNLVINQQVN